MLFHTTWTRGVLWACVMLMSSLVHASSINVTYRWVYANPRFVKTEGADGGEQLDYTHMGMLGVLPNGELAAAWQGAPVFWEGSDQQGIHLARSKDSGRSWSRPELLVSPGPRAPIWAPVVHVQDNRTWLFYSESRPQCWWVGEGGWHWACGGDLKSTVSSDSGHTWSKPQVVMSFDTEGGIAKMVANRLAVGPAGEWLLPFWREMGGHECTKAPQMHGRAGVLLSKDQGGSWETVNVSLDASGPQTWLIEASIAARTLKDDGFIQFFRTQVGAIYSSVSRDGQQWTAAEPLPLPNPNSKVDSLTLPNGLMLLAFNDAATARTPLSLAASIDGGGTWRRLLVLESDPRGSFSYPTLFYLERTGEVLVIYSVAFPPGYSDWWPWRCWGWLQSRVGDVVMRQKVPGDSKDGEQGNAWGFDAYGLRLAVINATDLLQITSEQ